MYRLPRTLTLRQQCILRRQPLRAPRFQRRWRSQIHLTPNGDPVRFQAVRFKKPGIFSLRRLATYGLYTGVAFAYVSLLFRFLDVEIEILDDEEDSHDHGGEGTGEEGEEEGEGPFFAEEDSLFIPLTWSKKMPRTFYRGSDPEWQEFLKVARDKPRHKKIQDELVQIVYLGSVSHTQISRQLGKDAKVGKYWLDISFPDSPPQEYQRSGIEVGDGFIAWSQQKISQENQWRLVRALWPSAAASGVWAATKTLAGIQYRRLKQALGWEGRDPFSPEERYRHMLEVIEKQQSRQNNEKVGNAQTGPESQSNAVIAPQASPSASRSSNSADSQKRLPWHIPVHLPNTASNGSNPTSIDIPIATHVFSHALSKSWNPKKLEPPRGTFIVQGLVEVRGSRGRILFDVQSAYDPRQGKYVQVSAGVRNFKRWNQAPKGGP